MTKLYKILFTANARKNLKKIETRIVSRILCKLNFYIKSSDPLSFSKKLNYSDVDLYRFRIGDYRVIFRISEDGTFSIISVVAIGHRKQIYKEL